MAEEIRENLIPTPIQRNSNDVAMELLDIYLIDQYESDKPIKVDDLINLYLKFYATAKMAERVHYKYLKEYLPEGLKEMADKF
ncbi:hypothetical protein AAGC94_01120 [Clostridium sporogenes]|jgi:RIO-like serine/threonine protein kinase|uniref:Uncharacterized protein n=3 Tax=Clostridium TaxID=1485 RepID=A0A1J1CUN5_CLOSG|nr:MULTISPECIES: hypothetical protein [Clostridium]AJD31186.1 hypothetical protein T258_1101 [Clostridium botulinum Prevot_594]MBE6075537.1 hypothetical protein [Clostridium lundense]AKC63049.1 hypothetical protein CLSPO_c23290 [Clostridium sporogenes]AKJ90275.1 hypothetical protein CLSPOx_11720 [Clostridium sporogenes]APF26347.1 hypothetical protein NPD7_745 [Clostridium sporogenes]